MRTTYCGLVSEALLGQTVTLMGWAHRRRDHGGVIFIDLRDREGLVQIVCDPDRAEMFCCRRGRAQRVLPEGRGPGSRAARAAPSNANLTSGKIEVLATSSRCSTPASRRRSSSTTRTSAKPCA